MSERNAPTRKDKTPQKRKTLTRAGLSEVVYQRIGLSRNESARLVDSFFTKILDGVFKEGYVKLASFGVFEARDRKPRLGRNMKTGEPIPIAKSRVLLFRPSGILKDDINAAMMKKTRKRKGGKPSSKG